MKQSIIPVWGKAFLLALPFMVSCQKDAEQDFTAGTAENGTVAEGSFIVDYTAGAESRAEASVRIQSLDYLVYENSGANGAYVLKKHRSIPDINTETVWPLTRNTMTWAQREALKDTLNTSCDYKVVFVANADADVWDEEVLKNVGTENTFEEARLFLPSIKTFDDTNMYYMWTGELSGASYSKNNPASMQILLERMINRVEVKLDETVAAGIAEKGVDTYVEEQLGAYFDANYVKEDNTGIILDLLDSYMKSIGNQLSVPSIGLTNEKETKNKFKNEYLLNHELHKNIVVTLENEIRTSFIDTQKDEMKRFSNWEAFTAATIVYDVNSYPSSIDFNKKTISANDESKELMLKPQNNCFLFYIFGNNARENNSLLNKISSIRFTISNSESVSIPVGQAVCEELIGGNYSLRLSYNPWNIDRDGVNTFLYTKNGYNLQTDLEWNEDSFEYGWTWGYKDLMNWLNGGINSAGISGTYNNMTLKLNIPKVEIVNPWTSKENK